MKQEAENISALDRFAEWYESSIPVRVGAVALAPATSGISAIADQAIVTTLAFLRRSRLRVFRDELITLDLSPSDEEVCSKEFVEAFLATASRVENTKREEKIRLFAHLFASYWRSGVFSEDSFDEYEEDLSLIDELSYREFKILSILDRLERENPMCPGMNRLQRARTFWNAFEAQVAKEIGVQIGEVQAYLQRLSRTGLYQIITGAYLDYEGGLGHLTPRFERLRTRLDVET